MINWIIWKYLYDILHSTGILTGTHIKKSISGHTYGSLV